MKIFHNLHLRHPHLNKETFPAQRVFRTFMAVSQLTLNTKGKAHITSYSWHFRQLNCSFEINRKKSLFSCLQHTQQISETIPWKMLTSSRWLHFRYARLVGHAKNDVTFAKHNSQFRINDNNMHLTFQMTCDWVTWVMHENDLYPIKIAKQINLAADNRSPAKWSDFQPLQI